MGMAINRSICLVFIATKHVGQSRAAISALMRLSTAQLGGCQQRQGEWAVPAAATVRESQDVGMDTVGIFPDFPDSTES